MIMLRIDSLGKTNPNYAELYEFMANHDYVLATVTL